MLKKKNRIDLIKNEAGLNETGLLHYHFTTSTYTPLGKSGSAPVDVRLPTGLPRTLKILLPGLPCRAF